MLNPINKTIKIISLTLYFLGLGLLPFLFSGFEDTGILFYSGSISIWLSGFLLLPYAIRNKMTLDALLLFGIPILQVPTFLFKVSRFTGSRKFN